MRRSLLITALLASHGVALWLGRHSPVAETAAASSPPAPAPGKPVATGLASFLGSSVKPAEEAATEDEAEAEEGEDEDSLLAAARGAIPADTDVAALVKAAAADPDLTVSRETRAAFGVWVDRDPVAALRWATEWARDYSGSPEDLLEEFSRHLREGGTAQLALYLREVPAARSFLFEQAAYVANDREPVFALQLAASLGSHEDRLELLAKRFRNDPDLKDHLASIRQLLDDSSAAGFLGEIIGFFPVASGLVEALEQSGYPPYAVAQFAADCAAGEGQTRTNADFIGTVANTTIPGVPAATGTNVTDIVTVGLRSGDGAINRNNIDAVLNNPNRTEGILMADKIRGYFSGGSSSSSVAWALFSSSDFDGIEGYAESRDQFLRGKITGEEWISAMERAVPSGSGLHDEISALAFRAAVEDDPRRALSLLSPSFPHQERLVNLPVSPEVGFLMAKQLSEGGEPSFTALSLLGQRFSAWFEEDPASCAAYVAEMPSGAMKESLAPWMEPPPDLGGEEGP
ncbi:hypothetical protein [Haloferula sp. BvORR071]|uniref:hypothetical protein n=1 Tax=Haloferula sp. BvORR071 TaxID=1396141 RepID=UPI00054D458D|nr:hypothetical protein [Haloferula sp. BvORR071]